MGISQVNQIVKEKPSTFLSPTEFEKKYHTKVCPSTFYGMTSTLSKWDTKMTLDVLFAMKKLKTSCIFSGSAAK